MSGLRITKNLSDLSHMRSQLICVRNNNNTLFELHANLQARQVNVTTPGCHRHARRREKIMGRFKSPRQAQRFLSIHDQIANLFRPKRHRLSARSYRHARNDAFNLWNEYTRQ